MNLISYYNVQVKKLGIEVNLNTEVNPKLMRSILHKFDVAIVAARARVDAQVIPDADQAIVINGPEAVKGMVDIGKNVVVLGGGKIGLTFAESLRAKGAEVTIVEAGKRIAEDVIPTWKWRHTAWVEEMKIGTQPNKGCDLNGAVSEVFSDLSAWQNMLDVQQELFSGML